MDLSQTPAPYVSILLSTYNGQQFLRYQLESLLTQDYPYITIHVRDDGSTDETIDILKQYSRKHSNLHTTTGPNLGAANSFFELLKEADQKCTYFAFCDQDDIWQPNKVSRAVAAIRATDSLLPKLYFSRVEYVDVHLRTLGISRKPRHVGFGNALVENCAPGCTMLMDAHARQLLLARVPTRLFMHDSWCYLVVSAFGHLVSDDATPIKYRQHAANVFGADTNHFSLIKSRLRRVLRGQTSEYRAQANEFHKLFGHKLDPKLLKVLDRFLCERDSISTRLSYALTLDVWRQSHLDNLLLRFLVLLGYF